MLFYGLTTYIVLIVTFNLPFLMEAHHFSSGNSGMMISLFFLAIMAPGFFLGTCCKVSEGEDKILQPAVYCTGIGTDMDFSQGMADHTGLHIGGIGLWGYSTVDL